ncbi:acyl-CoA dehydrogenase family protein [uncultured Thioclava sp.]|uniref:acyl-CoA dehydrogenase family protein n=1 Tax=uncultured Thioclava sp. TaxID=473858 RepID=UPI0025D4722A|nr:acyl-CoA dehydrogenase family protein [uncultured Thioclava sp.]
MLLDETHEKIRDAAHDFAQGRLVPGAAQRDRDHAFPREQLTEMGELGFLGMLVPEEYGGSDIGITGYALALEEIAAGDGACPPLISVPTSGGCVPILRFGPDAQTRRFLPQLARGARVGGLSPS